MLGKLGDRTGNFVQALIRKHTHFRIFQGNDIAGVHVVREAVKPDDVARHIKHRDLFTSVARKHGTF